MPQTLVIWRYGVKMCPCMIATLPMIEGRLKSFGIIKQDLSGLIFQGCWNSGVAASAGTHDGGGAIDVHPSIASSVTALRVWRESGVAMWHRTPVPGLWGEHAHGIWVGCPHLSSGARAQTVMYRDGYNGLANWGRDDGPRVGYITWQDALRAWDRSTPLTPVGAGGMGGGGPQGDEVDMASLDDLRKIVREEATAAANAAVQHYLGDVIPVPDRMSPEAKKANPNWMAQTFWRDTNALANMAAIRAGQATVAAQKAEQAVGNYLGDHIPVPDRISDEDRKKNPEWTAQTYWRNTNAHAYAANLKAGQALAVAQQTLAIVQAIAQKAGLTREEVQQAVQDAITSLASANAQITVKIGDQQ